MYAFYLDFPLSLSPSLGRIVNSHTQQPSCKDAHPIFTIHDMGPNMALALSYDLRM